MEMTHRRKPRRIAGSCRLGINPTRPTGNSPHRPSVRDLAGTGVPAPLRLDGERLLHRVGGAGGHRRRLRAGLPDDGVRRRPVRSPGIPATRGGRAVNRPTTRRIARRMIVHLAMDEFRRKWPDAPRPAMIDAA